MPVTGFMESAASGDSRQGERQRLRLVLTAGNRGGSNRLAIVHNISATGLLLECETEIAAGDAIEIALPHAGATSANIVWKSGKLYGCRFVTPVSSATLSAARLRGAVQRDADPDRQGPPIDTLGTRLLRLRKAAKLTQAEVASHLGVSEASVSAWEQDKSRPKAGRVESLATLLGVASSELLGLGTVGSLEDAVERAKSEIAAAAKIPPEHVQITIVL